MVELHPDDDPSLYVRTWTYEHCTDDELDNVIISHRLWAEEVDKEEGLLDHSRVLDLSYYDEADAYKDDPYMYLKVIAGPYASDLDYYDYGKSIIDMYMGWNGKDD